MTSDWRQAAYGGGRWTACGGRVYVGGVWRRAACGVRRDGVRSASCSVRRVRRAAGSVRRAAAASWIIGREKERSRRPVERMDRGDREACFAQPTGTVYVRTRAHARALVAVMKRWRLRGETE